jgi:hypothetical protein
VPPLSLVAATTIPSSATASRKAAEISTLGRLHGERIAESSRFEV